MKKLLSILADTGFEIGKLVGKLGRQIGTGGELIREDTTGGRD
jgi:hypothetical protein